jgi:hypothetical protein
MPRSKLVGTCCSTSVVEMPPRKVVRPVATTTAVAAPLSTLVPR